MSEGPQPPAPSSSSRDGAAPPVAAARRRSRWPLYLLIALGLAPIVASYVAFYVVRPEGRTNYGTLLEPQVDVPALELRTLAGEPFRFADLRGQWVMLTVDAASCDEYCESKLYLARQVRLTTGKDQHRIERVWIVTDGAPVPARLLREYEGMHVVRGDEPLVRGFLPVDAAAGTRVADHVYMIDPFGHVMMRFPRQADPNRVKRDVGKLMRASAGWIMLERVGDEQAASENNRRVGSP